jgi:hypothetical protein
VKVGKDSQAFVSNVQFEFRKDSEVSLYQRVGALMSRLKTVDPNLQILPATAHANLNPIIEGKNIPADTEIFKKYFTNLSYRNANVTFFARVETNQRVNQLKRDQQIFEYLKKWGIWMKYNQLSATDITAVAWVHNKHPDAISRKDLIGEMSQMLPSKFKDFQLTARNVSHTRGSSLKTRGWVTQKSREAAKERFGEFIKTFHPNAKITIVPLCCLESGKCKL